jgi:hypothetical protein
MRKSFALLALTLSILTSGAAFGAEGFFFGVSVNSTEKVQSRGFSSSSDAEVASSLVDKVSQTLASAGYEPKHVNDDVLSFTMNVNELSIPVLASKTENGDLLVKMLLTSVAQGQEVAPAKLLKLLDSNRNHQPATFTYNEELRHIELHVTVKAKNARGIQLRDELDLLAEIAGNTQKLWNVGKVVGEVDGRQVKLGLQQRAQLSVSMTR